jgi:hypothetical protein
LPGRAAANIHGSQAQQNVNGDLTFGSRPLAQQHKRYDGRDSSIRAIEKIDTNHLVILRFVALQSEFPAKALV